jgi:hypothetical protein
VTGALVLSEVAQESFAERAASAILEMEDEGRQNWTPMVVYERVRAANPSLYPGVDRCPDVVERTLLAPAFTEYLTQRRRAYLVGQVPASMLVARMVRKPLVAVLQELGRRTDNSEDLSKVPTGTLRLMLKDFVEYAKLPEDLAGRMAAEDADDSGSISFEDARRVIAALPTSEQEAVASYLMMKMLEDVRSGQPIEGVAHEIP